MSVSIFEMIDKMAVENGVFTEKEITDFLSSLDYTERIENYAQCINDDVCNALLGWFQMGKESGDMELIEGFRIDYDKIILEAAKKRFNISKPEVLQAFDKAFEQYGEKIHQYGPESEEEGRYIDIPLYKVWSWGFELTDIGRVLLDRIQELLERNEIYVNIKVKYQKRDTWVLMFAKPGEIMKNYINQEKPRLYYYASDKLIEYAKKKKIIPGK